MKFDKFLTFALALALGITGCNAAEDNADAAAGKEQEDAAKPVAEEIVAEEEVVMEAPAPTAEDQKKVDELLAYLPEVVVARGADKAPMVTREELVKEVRPVVLQAVMQARLSKQEFPEQYLRGGVYQLTDSLVVNKLLLEAARAKGINADEAKCKQSLDEIKSQMGAEALASELKEMGMTEADLSAKIAERDIVNQYIQNEVLAKVQVPEATEADAREFYDKNAVQFKRPAGYSASHILVQFKSKDATAEEEKAALDKINDIRSKLAGDGSNFAELAKEFSDCPSKEQGGSLGEFPVGAMVKEFEEALAKMEDGQISGPVRTQFGYHIIKAGPKHEESVTPFEEVKDQLVKYLGSMKRREADGKAVEGEIKRLRDAAVVEIKLEDPMAALSAPAAGEAK